MEQVLLLSLGVVALLGTLVLGLVLALMHWASR
jgi:hypothetical protein